MRNQSNDARPAPGNSQVRQRDGSSRGITRPVFGESRRSSLRSATPTCLGVFMVTSSIAPFAAPLNPDFAVTQSAMRLESAALPCFGYRPEIPPGPGSAETPRPTQVGIRQHHQKAASRPPSAPSSPSHPRPSELSAVQPLGKTVAVGKRFPGHLPATRRWSTRPRW